MTANCSICGTEIPPGDRAARRNVTQGICDGCVASAPASALIESIDAPVLLMQGNPRQVVTANRKALALFGKELPEVENHRGGQVFNCVHSYTEAGCGKDANCEDCRIKNAIVDTFATDNAHRSVSAELSIRRAGGTKTCALQVSTEKVGDFALVRIDRYAPGA